MSMLTPTGAIRAWWSISMILITAVLLVAVNVAYTARQQREADRRWCALFASLDQPNVPATTPRGQQVQQRIHQLRHDLGCGSGQ